MPSVNITKPKDKVNIEFVNVKPFGIIKDVKLMIPNTWKIFTENKKRKKRKDSNEIIIPVTKINLKGNKENETNPSIAKMLALKKEKFVFPANLSSLLYSIPICLNPTHDLSPRINKFFSFKLFKFLTIFLFIKQKSPAFFGTSISLSFEYIS